MDASTLEEYSSDKSILDSSSKDVVDIKESLIIPAEVILKEEINVGEFEDENNEYDDFEGEEPMDNAVTTEENAKQFHELLLENAAKKRKMWIHPSLSDRAYEGEFAKIFKNLKSNKEEFKKHFLISYDKFNQLLEIIRPHIERRNTTLRAAISPEERLAVFLRYLASGMKLNTIAANFKIGTSTASMIVHNVAEVIALVLPPHVMPKPTEDTWHDYENNFNSKYSLPHCLGIIDGLKISVNLKSHEFHLMLLAVIDANSKFIIVNIGDFNKLFGANGGILNNCLLGRLLDSELLKLPPDKPLVGQEEPVPYFFIGTNVIPLKANIMRPYSIKSKEASVKEKVIFNEYLSKASQSAELAFKMLLSNFKVYHQKFIIKPEYVKNVILATCCLHNFLIDDTEGEFEKAHATNRFITKLPPSGGNTARKEGKRIRDTLRDYLATQTNAQNEENINNG